MVCPSSASMPATRRLPSACNSTKPMPMTRMGWQVVRTGWFREVAIKSMDAQALRMLLMARAQLVSQRQAVANNIRGLLKTFGFVIARGSNGPFSIRVREVMADNPTLGVIVEPLLLAWQAIREQVATLDRQVNLRAKS